jgi:hypothetical protein
MKEIIKSLAEQESGKCKKNNEEVIESVKKV